MKFKYKIQDYQTEAVESVVKVFEGQPFKDRVSYLRDVGEGVNKPQISIWEEDMELADGSGFENARIELNDTQLLDNIRAMQMHNNIMQSDELSKPLGRDARCSLDIEMETGTGKTYCYIKTAFELNKKYGWSKFIVVVPSIAIREGVLKTIEDTEEHFFQAYGKKARKFIYSSKNLNEIDNFSASKDIYIMIINAQAFNTRGADARRIYEKLDEFQSRRPIDVIKANRPILILDEPQKLGGAATQDSLKLFNPLFSINYSATHKDVHNLIYVLDALDAFTKKLVKKIEVKGFELRNLRGTDGFVHLSQIMLSEKKPPMAKITFEINYKKGINRDSRIVGVDYNLYDNSAGADMPSLEQYKNGYVVKEINPINNTITFLNGITIRAGEVLGDISERDMRRIQIRETILSHFEKEEKLFYKGIKCLSLFFIDEVAKYRQYDDAGNELNGEYGVMFEEEYTNILNDYLNIVETPYIKYLNNITAHATHRGYFSIDKKTSRMVDPSVVKKTGESDDISAYDLILKNKARLLDFAEPTRFIFSHSALREGWDNPNVFQICTLKQSDSSVGKRQEVGRGMRLCVNQNGERIDSSVPGIKVHEINKLTVIASDSYKKFVVELQKDIKKDLYERPTKATKEYFVGKFIRVGETTQQITKEQAKKIEFYLIQNGYIDENYSVTDKYRDLVESKDFAPLPKEIAAIEEGVHKLVQGIFDESVLDDMIEEGNKAKIEENILNENFYKKEFQLLWNYINHKYAYSVDYDSEELIKNSIAAINNELFVTELTYVRAIGAQNNELDFTDGKTKTVTLKNTGGSNIKYDLVGKICQGAVLTRKSVVKILQSIQEQKFAMFKNNPEEFITKIIRYINEQKATMIVEKITYSEIDGTYDSSIFTAEKNVINFEKAYKAKKHITPWVEYDSDKEKSFAIDMDNAEEEVCVYAKLPRTFRIPTPVGNYAPDWAIAFYEGSVKHIYFVAETKGSMESLQLKKIEKAKTDCARKLFGKLSFGKVRYEVADTYQHLMDLMNK